MSGTDYAPLDHLMVWADAFNTGSRGAPTATVTVTSTFMAEVEVVVAQGPWRFAETLEAPNLSELRRCVARLREKIETHKAIESAYVPGVPRGE